MIPLALFSFENALIVQIEFDYSRFVHTYPRVSSKRGFAYSVKQNQLRQTKHNRSVNFFFFLFSFLFRRKWGTAPEFIKISLIWKLHAKVWAFMVPILNYIQVLQKCNISIFHDLSKWERTGLVYMYFLFEHSLNNMVFDNMYWINIFWKHCQRKRNVFKVFSVKGMKELQ